jgi:signal transduction histidine kinase
MTAIKGSRPRPSLATWLAPPQLPTNALRRQARGLWLVSWPLLGVVVLSLGLLVLIEPDTLWRRVTTVSAVAALVIILHEISRRGRPELSSWIFVIGLTVIVTQRAWITGGIHAPVAVFYVLFIVIGGALLGMRGAFATAVVAVAGAIVLTAGGSLALLTPRPGAGSQLAGFVFVMLAIGLALVLQTLVSARSRQAQLDPHAVQMIVHDMRSPLHVVLGHLEILRDAFRGAHARDVEGAMSGAATINRMTNNLLDVSRLEAGRLPIRRVLTDVAALAHEVVGTFQILQSSRALTVVTRGETTCDCDRDIIRRVVENLVSNAIKYTPEGGKIVVAVSGDSRRLQIAVKDDGPGISAQRKPKIFEPFSAEGTRTESGYDATGLGLAFCQLAVEAHGGTIHVEDAVPRGSIFVADLPR